MVDVTIQPLGPEDKILRRHAELDFKEFTRQAAPHVIGDKFVWNWHIDVMCDMLQATTERRYDRILFNIPPGCTKSTIISVLWPAWVWCIDPTESFLCLTYNSDLTIRDAVACRELIGGNWYQTNWGHKVQVKFGEDSKPFFKLTAGGWRLSTTRRGRATGDHPSNIIIDDPFSAEQAYIQEEREAFMNYYTGTLSTRGATKGARHVLAQQRLHRDDPSGRLLQENTEAEQRGEKEVWAHVMLPMRYDPANRMNDYPEAKDPRTVKGELLYPALLPEAAVARIERSLGKVKAAAQLGQKPVVTDGSLFEMSKIKIIPPSKAPKKYDEVVRFWDRAGTEGGDGAQTAGVLIGRKGDRIFLIDAVVARLSPGSVETLIENTLLIDEKIYGFDRLRTIYEIEPASGGKRQAEITRKRLKGHNVYGVLARGAKEARAQPLAIAIEYGEITAIAGEYLPPMFDEMTVFPSGKLKDRVDAFGGAYLELVNPTMPQSKVATSVDGDESEDEPEECASRFCTRMTTSRDGYCCKLCKQAEEEGEGDRHTPQCHSDHNDWWMKHGGD